MACPFDNPYEESVAPRPGFTTRRTILNSRYAGMTTVELSHMPLSILDEVYRDGFITRLAFKRALRIKARREARELVNTPIR